jgi:carbohydrate-selective porin OprB
MLAVLVVALAADAPPTPADETMTGSWWGGRSWLDGHGVRLDLAYTGEVFVGRGGAYRGNADVQLTVSPFPDMRIFVYGQNGHGSGISEDAGVRMPVSNLEADEFTKLSEAWIEQKLGDHLRLRLGKQDANREFAAPRFPGNFINSSYGALPTSPIPSFPFPKVGAFLEVTAIPGLAFRTAAYDSDEGLMGVASLVIAGHSVGYWLTPESAGVFGVLDFFFPLGEKQSLQTFARVAWNPGLSEGTIFYAGGGATWHGFAGRDDTVGLGAGHVRGDPDPPESFIELFYKARFTKWFSLEPDFQMFFHPGDILLVAGLRGKIKL